MTKGRLLLSEMSPKFGPWISARGSEAEKLHETREVA